MLHKDKKKKKLIVIIIKLECIDGKLFEYFQGMYIVCFFLTNSEHNTRLILT